MGEEVYYGAVSVIMQQVVLQYYLVYGAQLTILTRD